MLLDDVPPIMHNKACMLAFGELIGKPIAVDEDCLARLGPVRTRIWCSAPERVHGFIEVYSESVAFRIKVRVEGSAPASVPPPIRVASPPGPDDHSNGRNTDCEALGLPFPKKEWDALGPKLQSLYTNRRPACGGAKESEAPAAPVAACLTDAGVSPLTSAVCSNVPIRPASSPLSGIEDSLEHGGSDSDVEKVTTKRKMAAKKFCPRSRASAGTKLSAAGLIRLLDSEMGAAA